MISDAQQREEVMFIALERIAKDGDALSNAEIVEIAREALKAVQGE